MASAKKKGSKKGAKKRKGAVKTVKKASCASNRAFAGGKKKGRCVPKGGLKATTKKSTRACYAKTRDQAIINLELYDKRKKSIAAARAKKLEKQHDALVGTQPGPEAHGEGHFPSGPFEGLGRRRRRRSRRR
jgi:hypothetical protein